MAGMTPEEKEVQNTAILFIICFIGISLIAYWIAEGIISFMESSTH